MEISNNLLTTLSAVDSPNQPSEENPLAPKSAKKKVPGEESSFDGALATATTPPIPAPDLGKLKGELPSAKEEVTDQVELSTKGKASAAAQAEGGAPAPTIASLFQAKAQKSANGPIAGAFVAGPDQPWGSRWVFAGGNQPSPEEIEAVRTAGTKPAPLKGVPLNLDQMKKLVEQAKAQGGDESQLKSAADSTLKDIDSAIAALGGELEGVRGSQQNGEPAKAAPKVMGGAEFISTLQGTKAPLGTSAVGNTAVATSALGTPAKSAPVTAVAYSTFDPSALEADPVAGASVGRANLVKPDLQVLPGGLPAGSGSTGGRLEGGLRLAKDEPKLQTDTFYPNGMPLTAAVRQDGQLGTTPPPTVTGHVVLGSMARERLTSESLRNVSNSIAGMSGTGGGEMRIKLNPGNLGELMIRVSTNGKDVGLKVQANDPAAKKVIEESLGALRDSLAQQSLALGRVDVTVTTTNASSDFGSNTQHSSNGQAAFNGFDGQSPNQGRFMDGSSGNEDRSSRTTDSGSERGVARGVSSRIAAMGTGGASARAGASSRLDVMA